MAKTRKTIKQLKDKIQNDKKFTYHLTSGARFARKCKENKGLLMAKNTRWTSPSKFVNDMFVVFFDDSLIKTRLAIYKKMLEYEKTSIAQQINENVNYKEFLEEKIKKIEDKNGFASDKLKRPKH